MGNVVNTKLSVCVPNPAEAKMKRSRTTSADEDQDQGDSSGEQVGPMDRLIAAASVGLESIELTEAGKSEMAELLCAHCHSMLFKVRIGVKLHLTFSTKGPIHIKDFLMKYT